MKRVTLWVCIALLTFSIGVACAFLWFLDRSSAKLQHSATSNFEHLLSQAEPLDLVFCHLAAVPESYGGKLIRVQATYVMGMHGATLSDRNCSSFETRIWVSVSPTMWQELERAMEKAYESKDVTGELDMVAVGRFGRNHRAFESDSLTDNAPYRFELIRIERDVSPRCVLAVTPNNGMHATRIRWPVIGNLSVPQFYAGV